MQDEIRNNEYLNRDQFGGFFRNMCNSNPSNCCSDNTILFFIIIFLLLFTNFGN